MKGSGRLFILTLLLLFILSFSGCGSPSVAEKPCLMVNDTIYYLSHSDKLETIPSGYECTGIVKKVTGHPRSNFTGNCANDSLIYVSQTAPNVVYLLEPSADSFLCFTVENLQFNWIMINSDLYLWEDDYVKLKSESERKYHEVLNSTLPETAFLIGRISSIVKDALPTDNLQANRQQFEGYAVYKDTQDDEIAYLVPKVGQTEALYFIRITGGF
jgi:hypothetical protein